MRSRKGIFKNKRKKQVLAAPAKQSRSVHGKRKRPGIRAPAALIAAEQEKPS